MELLTGDAVRIAKISRKNGVKHKGKIATRKKMRKIALQRKNAGGGWRGRAAVALAFAVGCVGLGFNVQNELDGVGGNVALATEYFQSFF